MAGKRYKNDLGLTQAYTEGQTAKIASALQNTNPHVDGSEKYAAWDAGWTAGTSGTDFAGGAMCSQGGYSSPPGDPVLAINKATATIVAGATTTIVATVTISGAAVVGRAVAAVSSVPGKATVAGDGNTNSSGQVTFTVTGVAAGETTITVTATPYLLTKTCVVTVTAA